jgi:hypothetical protein
LNIKNGDDVYYVPVDIADQKGNVDTYAESLIKFLPQLEKGINITIKGYNFTPEGDKYSKIGISISVDGNKIKSELTNAYVSKEGVPVEGNIPALVWKKDALGKNKPTAVSQEAKNDYLLEVLKAQTDRLKWVQGESRASTPTPKVETKSVNTLPPQTPAQAFPPAGKLNTEEPDDLPF